MEEKSGVKDRGRTTLRRKTKKEDERGVCLVMEKRYFVQNAACLWRMLKADCYSFSFFDWSFFYLNGVWDFAHVLIGSFWL